MGKPFVPRGLATAIGSLPHTDPEAGCALMRRHLPEIPLWPQLPRRSPLENMYAQYSRAFPGVQVGDDRVWVDRALDLTEGLARILADSEAGQVSGYGLTPQYAAGFGAFLERVQGGPLVAAKGQVTGPVSWGLTVTDEARRPLLYDETLAQAIAQMLRLQAAWQEGALRAVCLQTIVFLDEPYLSAFGSAFVSLSREQAASLITTTLEGISGLRGVHCCGNTDWSLLLETPLDILNFDAYSFAVSLSLYPEALSAFLERGGVIAWGIVPNEAGALAGEDVDSLLARLEEAMGLLVAKGLDVHRLRAQCLITPSCGLAGLTEVQAGQALSLTAAVSRAFRARYWPQTQRGH
ncbi:MAG: methionine synthase [Chloroflexi bacterium]|nr:methionine synthase [Chloroflexota bacterium]